MDIISVSLQQSIMDSNTMLAGPLSESFMNLSTIGNELLDAMKRF
jgi:hypothetical protein